MTLHKYFIPGSFALLFMACGGSADPSKLFEIRLGDNRDEFVVNERAEVRLQNKDNKAVEAVTYSIDGKTLPVEDSIIRFDIEKLGDKVLHARVKYEDNTVEISKKIRVLAAAEPEVYTYEIVNEFPHDIDAFTQGLEFYRDTLYESTGQKGSSTVRQVDFRTGEVLRQIPLDTMYFGEGITVLNDKIYQLTWQGGIGFVYDLGSFTQSGSFQYGESKEGWGLCNDGRQLYKSDGTDRIWFLNPETLVEEGFLQIVTNKSVFNKANELEYVNGKIYANVWQRESMMIIDAHSGAIEGVVNFGGLKELVKKHDRLDVLNGVAYHRGRKTFFVTGKRWDKLFEVRLKERDK